MLATRGSLASSVRPRGRGFARVVHGRIDIAHLKCNADTDIYANGDAKGDSNTAATLSSRTQAVGLAG